VPNTRFESFFFFARTATHVQPRTYRHARTGTHVRARTSDYNKGKNFGSWLEKMFGGWGAWILHILFVGLMIFIAIVVIIACLRAVIGVCVCLCVCVREKICHSNNNVGA